MGDVILISQFVSHRDLRCLRADRAGRGGILGRRATWRWPGGWV